MLKLCILHKNESFDKNKKPLYKIKKSILNIMQKMNKNFFKEKHKNILKTA